MFFFLGGGGRGVKENLVHVLSIRIIAECSYENIMSGEKNFNDVLMHFLRIEMEIVFKYLNEDMSNIQLYKLFQKTEIINDAIL